MLNAGSSCRTVAIVQARTGSTRLPGKVLLDLLGQPMLAHVVARLRRCRSLDGIVIATTTEAEDDPIVALCRELNCDCFRGSRDDVLDRYFRAAREARASVVVRVTADCPLVASELVDQIVLEFARLQPDVDYASNTLPPRSFPRGLDTEVFRFDVLERIQREDRNPDWREHVTPYIYRHPGLFRLHAVRNDADLSALRWTVDTPEDLELVRQIYSALGGNDFSWRQALALVERDSRLRTLNAEVVQKCLQ